ncbi:hypothetical protein DFH09DRAFT_1186363 [Mycena vulgaris]|nr:hypothetical protein DFH09DRAFT_1186363 [Mycena vulgaris]
MEEPSNPLRIQELVNQCIRFLCDSIPDLKACAVVSRSWAGAAQACLFRRVSLETSKSQRRWSLLQEAMHISPHLIRHIRQLHLDSDGLSNETFSGMCNFPFTHLQDVSIFILFGHKLSLQGAIDVQQLLSLPTLRQVTIYFDSIQPSVFWPIWQRASPSIRHINIAGGCTHPKAIPPNFHASTPLVLETLNMECEGSVDWLKPIPMDLSRLKVLSVGEQIHVVRWKGFTPALRTIEALSFNPGPSGSLELSSFPHLTMVRIIIVGPDAWPAVLAALATIAPTTRIHTIILGSWTVAAPPEQLDVLLSNLAMPHPPAILLEMKPLRYSRWTPHLPRLISKKLLYRIDYNSPWLDFPGVV